MIAPGTVALGAGTALALAAALVVLGPLWAGAGDDAAPADRRPDDADAGASSPAGPAARVDGVSPVDALREIEFDRATGKLAEADYAALKATYTREALADLRARQAPAPVAAPAARTWADDPVEAALRAYRARAGGAAPACPVHGERPQPDAVFCSDCGRFLAGACPACGARCDEEGQRFCAACGADLGAGPPAAVPAGAA